MGTTKIQVTPQGQYVTTIPKPLAEAMGLKKSQVVRWKVAGAGRLEVTF